MNGLISLLLKSGGGMLLESIEAYVGGVLVRRTVREIIRTAAIYAMAGILALAALIFFYIFLYVWIAARMDGESAAAILCGGNLIAIALALLARRLMSRRPKIVVREPGNLLGRLTEASSGLSREHLEAGIAAGAEVGRKLRKAAPEIALVAGIVGLIIGVRPELLNLLAGKAPSKRNPGKRDPG